MRRGERLALGVLVGLVVLAGGAAGAATYAWSSAGTARLAIHEEGPDGNDVSVRFPGLLLNAAIRLVPMPCVVDDPETAAALAAFEAAADELARMPDAVLVDVEERGATVRIEKRGGRVIVRVRDDRDRVEIEVPIGSVRMLAAKLGRAARAGSASPAARGWAWPAPSRG